MSSPKRATRLQNQAILALKFILFTLSGIGIIHPAIVWGIHALLFAWEFLKRDDLKKDDLKTDEQNPNDSTKTTQ